MESLELVTLENLIFNPAWIYENPATGSFYRSGIITGRVLFSEIKGTFSEYDVERIAPLFRSCLSRWWIST